MNQSVSNQYIKRVVDLTDPAANRILKMSVEEARERILRGPAAAVRQIERSFALVAKEGKIVRMARSLDRPLRYFLAKRHEGSRPTKAYDQSDATVFIRLNAPRLKVAARVQRKK